MRKLFYITIGCFITYFSNAQPEPCEVNAMTSTCADACVVCDIDGFTGTNDLTIQGQTFPEFCTTIFHNMSYIAFIAGTEDLTLTVSVNNCTIGRGVEIGIFESTDCQNFTPMTECNTDVAPNSTATFSNTEPLIIGQYYYLILDGSMGDICDWTFNVIEGSTLVGGLTTSGIISGPVELCSNFTTTYSTTVEPGATQFNWTVNGIETNDSKPEINLIFPTDGTYEICVTASNVCDEAPTSCTTINVLSPVPTYLNEIICATECFEANNESICESGTYDFSITLPDGCDSLVYLDLTILPEQSSTVDINLCIGNEFFIGNSSFSTTGTHEQIIPTELGCDSLVILNLTMIECEIIGTTSSISPICSGDSNGSILVTLQNGTPSFEYSWANLNQPSIQGTETTNQLTNITIEDIPAGLYEIYIKDQIGNDIVFIQLITDPSPLFIDIIKSEYNGYNISCFSEEDGFISVTGLGGVPPYSYLWNNQETDTTLRDLSAGIYNLELTDHSGCIQSEIIELIEPENLQLFADFISPNCTGLQTGLIETTSIHGGTPPYSIAINTEEYTSTLNYENLESGIYNLSVIDANACFHETTGELDEIDIPILYMSDDEEIDLGCSTIISATINNTSLDIVNWSNEENSLDCDECLYTDANPVNNTTYTLTVTSIDECKTTGTVTVNVNKIRDIYSPNIFSPNNDGINDYFMLTPGKSVSSIKTIHIYDRWGSVLYSETDNDSYTNILGWDGFSNGRLASPGVYIWVAEVEYLDGVILTQSGDITLL